MNNIKLSLLSLFVFLTLSVSAQKLLVTGKVMEQESNKPLSFSTIRIFDLEEKLLNGNLSNELGEFSIEIPSLEFYLEVDYIGYQTIKTEVYRVAKDAKRFSVGELKMNLGSNSLDEVTVTAEKSQMEFTLDKRVFNVGKDLSSLGGNAADILVNIPSVTVDPDGAIKLRGSGNVRILIDGQPSGLVSFKGGAGLKQLQASMIDRVEVITNPSARYEAEGMAGIINIILKKDRKTGFNGSYEVVLGLPANYGLAANINYRQKKINFFVNYALSFTNTPSWASTFQNRTVGEQLYILRQRDEGSVTGLNNNIRGGLDYFFNENSILTASYLFSRSDGGRTVDLVYEDFLGSLSNPTAVSTRSQVEDEIEPISEYVLNYKRTFEKEGHVLSAQFRFLDHWENSDQVFTENFFGVDGKTVLRRPSVQKSINDEFEKQYLFQLDYTQPFAKKGKFEAGVRSSFRDMVNDYEVTDEQENGTFVPLPEFVNYFVYDENIHAAYGILGNEGTKVSYQVGARLEWTDVQTELRDTKEVNPRNYMNLFPSAHLSYHLGKENSLQLSYSKRVRRPVYNDLSPFMTFRDSRNFFSGNPDLNPEFSDVVELGHLKYFEKASISSAIYYRNTVGLIDRIRTLNEVGFATTRPENLNSEKAIGGDITADFKPYKWWKMDWNLNVFNAKIDGSNIQEDYKAQTTTWFTRYNSRFTLKNGLDIQLRLNYDAPRLAAQGSRKAIAYADLAASKEILKGGGRLNLSVSDIFNSRISRYTNFGSGFVTDGESQGRLRQVNLTFNYKFNQDKKQ